MQTLNVNLGERSYPIYIGAGLLGKQDLLGKHVKGSQVLIVTNETVAPLYLVKTQKMLTDFQVETLILPDGEEYKNLATLNKIYSKLLEIKFNRNCTLAALGGGVIGDITGFGAASYQRGVNFMQIPTTLLAQVDSSVGGKTGVNHELGKNMIGAFHQPQCVLIDTNTLATLDERQFAAGLAEIIKYGLINDADFFSYLATNMDLLLAKDRAVIASAVQTSCHNKAQVVALDEKESGIRALLNLGHTFAHAIESGMGYGKWLHGEAVAAGMLMAADLSVKMGWLKENEFTQIKDLITRANLPVRGPGMEVEKYLKIMALDKKSANGIIRLILLKAIGQATVVSEYSNNLLRETLKEFG